MRNFTSSKLNKQIISLITSVVMLIASMPIADISNETQLLFNRIIASAEDVEKYTIDNGVCTINSFEDLVKYSKAYQAYSSEYQNVDVIIGITDETTSLEDFVSIGTADYPFKASMKINEDKPLNVSLNVPLFDYIYDTSKILINKTEGGASTITLARKSNTSTAVPLFANNVIHNNYSEDYAEWSVIVQCDSDENAIPYDIAGIIGTMGEGSKAELKIKNDAIKEQSSGILYGNISGTGNVGLACGTMKEDSELSVSIYETGTNTQYSVTSSGGSAGGLVGKMEIGSKLIVNSAVKTSGIISAGDYAGGLVGYAQNSVVEFTYSDDINVQQNVSGSSGTGGVFGCYENGEGNTFEVKNYKANCTLNGDNAGGIIGKLVNKGTVNIDGTNSVTASRDSTESNNYGGIIGNCTSESTGELYIKDITVNISKSGTSSDYGGVIGSVDANAYINISGVTVNASNCNSNVTSFGGLVGYSAQAFIDADNVTVSVSTDSSEFKGGGVIGNMNSGVLRLSGKTDLSGTKAISGGGQIVGTRGNQALIYAQSGWELIRGSEVTVDDIGTWGQVVRFSDKFSESDVLTVDEYAHTVTVNAANTTISSLGDFAILALNIQMNDGENAGRLGFENTTDSKSAELLTKNITLDCSIDLSGTGITGLTRDDGTNDPFTGTFDGGNNKITLAVGEAYGKRGGADVTDDEAGNGRIYRHRYNGLFAKTNGATFKNLTVDGSILFDSAADSVSFAGGLSAEHTGGDFIAENVTVSENISISAATTQKVYCGGMTAKISGLGKLSIDKCTISPKITCTKSGDQKYISGGAVGEISSMASFTADVSNTTVSAEISNDSIKDNSRKTGGLIAYIASYNTNSSNRKISLKNVTVENTKISTATTTTEKASDNTDLGGALLGELWNNVDVVFGDDTDSNAVTVKSSTVIMNTGNGNFAGLVSAGSGYWQVNDVDINGITINGSEANSFGMFVNKGSYKDNNITKALYLELTATGVYNIDSGASVTLGSATYYDELMYNGDGGLVSIHTTKPTGEDEPKVIMDGENCNTYQNQVTIDNIDKRTTNKVKYYYNLDFINNKVIEGMATPEEKLMIWSVYINYPYLRPYFNNNTNPYTNNTIPKADYDLKGYSYYPINVSGYTIESGSTFKFYNHEFEASENGTGNDDNYVRSTRKYTQHHAMHCGLFYTATSITVNDVIFQGSIGTIGNGNGKVSGVIACNQLKGNSKIRNIVLDGIYVDGFLDSSDAHAALLAGSIGNDSDVEIRTISTTNKYIQEDNTTKRAASCLIGNAGNASNGNNIKIVFKDIRLDARKKALDDTNANDELNEAYNTTTSIFTNSTLMNAFMYPSGKNCSAVYNYKYDEDWNENGTPLHNVTYGWEITNSVEYEDHEKKYIGSKYYTNPTELTTVDNFTFDADTFLPYVKNNDLLPDAKTKYNAHEIKVNVMDPDLNVGCGTYNDPFIISDAEQLMLVADILGGVEAFSDGTTINYKADNYKTWCDEKDDTSHCMYVWDSANSKFYPPIKENGEVVIDSDSQKPVADTGSTDTHTVAEIRTALSTAYYQLDENITESITLTNKFKGLGANTPFMGVIDGNGKTITNESVNPLIYNSKGSVVKDLTVNVTAVFSSSFKSVNANTTYATDVSGSTPFYGGIFGIVNGGDNIIDNVSVTINNADSITSDGTYAGNVAVGGYVGVVRYGGVIFRNMSGATKPYFRENDKFGEIKSGSVYLYFNPIIGRVIDGYAFTETDKYTPREDNDPTMQNGTKNYSIADINTSAEKITFEDSKIKVHDGQALFLMGCIAMSGAGSANTSTGKYSSYGYGSSQMMRGAEYNHIGEDTTTDDYNLAKVDNFANTSIPYIISKYTNDTISARKLTTGTFSIELTGTEYTLPDSFRGIGSMNNSSDDLEMTLSGFDGKGQTIEMNSNFYAYKLNGGYDQYYKANTNQAYNLNVGLGLFNKLVMSDDSEFKNLTLSGNATVTIYTSHSSTNQLYDGNASMCAGMLAGISMKNTFTVNDVKLLNANVDTMSISGGLIGILRDGSSKTFTANRVSADNLSVAGGQCAGGLVGYVYGFTCNVNKDESQNSEFLINSISTNSTSGNWNNVYQGCGGIFGALQKSTVDINNISIDKSTAEGSAGSITSISNTAFAGGVIGCGKNPSEDTIKISITNTNVKNIDITYNKNSGDTAFFGGIIGGIKNAKNTTINLTNINVTGDENNPNTIKGYTEAGGLIGLQLGDMTADNCTVENYNMQTIKNCATEGAGGFIGKSESISGTSQNAVLKNSKISNCNIQTDNGKQMPAGMIVGMTNNKIQFSGYNILVNNVQLTKLDGTAMIQTDTVGNITGHIYNGSTVKLVGLCKQNESNVTTVGDFGTNSGSAYVIYSDYDGVCTGTSPNEEKSMINYSETDNVTYITPFATINPKTQIDGSSFLTGDGASMTAIANILADIDSSANKAYTNVSGDSVTFRNYESKLSTFNKETGADIKNNFPVLVVNDSNHDKVTSMINSYIHLLINDTSVVNYATDNDDKYEVVISQYRYDESTKTFNTSTDYIQTLSRDGTYFGMSDKDYDSNYTQFTLLDIQYKNPANTAEVAYHLYIPLMVEKMLKFDFEATVLSGTTYKKSSYKDSTVMENYGTPVTAHITYSYQRTVTEWQDAINNGENILKYYGKSIKLTSNSDLPDDTQLVIVDRNNSDKAYYSTIGDAFVSSEKKLYFDKFKSVDDTAFSPVSFYDLISKSADITATPSESGQFVQCEEDEATVKTKDGVFLRKITDSDTDSTLYYEITVTPLDASLSAESILPVEEDYYISFFTKANDSAVMRNITIDCDIRLDDAGMTPSHITTNIKKATMIFGNLYDQKFSFSTTNDNEVMDEINDTISASMSTIISIKNNDDKEAVKTYLNDSSIHLYHGFVIELTKRDELGTEKGVKGQPTISGAYTVGDKEYQINKNCSESVIELLGEDANGVVDISKLLRSEDSVTIECNDLKIKYSESEDLSNQFPKRSENSTNGVTLSANSNLAYVTEDILYSSMTSEKNDSLNKSYYREGEISAATLNYNIPYGTSDADELSKLGINGNENPEEITAIGYYNVSMIPEEDLDKASKLRFDLALYQKDGNGAYQYVDINDYLSNIKLYDKNDTAYNAGNGTCTFEIATDALNYESGIYEVKSTYSVRTSTEFENSGYIYSNYKVLLTVQLLDNDGNIIANTGSSDYIIYTNAKICTELLTAVDQSNTTS